MAVRPSAVLLLAATAAFFAACSDNTPSGPGTAPEIGTPNVSTPDSAGPVLVVSVATLHADSARIVAASVPVGFHVKTDYVHVANDTARLVLAGLRPGLNYLWHVDAVGPGGKRSGPGLTLTADSLPPAIRSAKIVTTAGSVPTVPYIATELTADSTKYETIFDSTGALVWYRVMARPSSDGDFEMQPTGAFTAFDGTTFGWQPVPGTWLSFGLDGVTQRTWTAPSGSFTDQHEFRMRVEGGDTVAYFSVYDIVPMDMTAHCGTTGQPTAAHILVRADAGVGRPRSDLERGLPRCQDRPRTRLDFESCDTCRAHARHPVRGRACAVAPEIPRIASLLDSRPVAMRRGTMRARRCRRDRIGSRVSWSCF